MLTAELSTPVNLRGDIYRGVGNTVDITPLFTEGIAIATYEINGEEGVIYTPIMRGGSTFSQANITNRIQSNSNISGRGEII